MIRLFEKRIKRKRYFDIQELAFLDEYLRTEIGFCKDTIERYKHDGHLYAKNYVHDAKIKKSAFEKVLRKMYQI